jgi:hypothetical protein
LEVLILGGLERDFPEVLILVDFKPIAENEIRGVLEVLILEGLKFDFPEVLILEGLRCFSDGARNCLVVLRTAAASRTARGVTLGSNDYTEA